MDTVIKFGAKAAPYFIAITMAIYGVQHFIYLQFVADFIPAWIPWRTFWACFTGLALMASAVGILFKAWDQWAATLLGTMIFLWVILLHTFRLAAQPQSPDEWRGIFQALSMSAFVFVLAGVLHEAERPFDRSRNRFSHGMNALCDLGVRFSRPAIAISMVAFGMLHFVFADAPTPKVPLWIPGNMFGTYLTGAALIAAGTGIFFQRTARIASALLGIMIFLSMIFVHMPVVLASPRFESDWCKTLVMSGGAFLLARTLQTEKQRDGFRELPASAIADHAK